MASTDFGIPALAPTLSSSSEDGDFDFAEQLSKVDRRKIQNISTSEVDDLDTETIEEESIRILTVVLPRLQVLLFLSSILLFFTSFRSASRLILSEDPCPDEPLTVLSLTCSAVVFAVLAWTTSTRGLIVRQIGGHAMSSFIFASIALLGLVFTLVTLQARTPATFTAVTVAAFLCGLPALTGVGSRPKALGLMQVRDSVPGFTEPSLGMSLLSNLPSLADVSQGRVRKTETQATTTIPLAPIPDQL